MKTIPANKYEYLGTCGKYHMFKLTLNCRSKEIICVEEARLLKDDGSSVFFNTISDKKLEYPMETFAV